MKLIFKTKNGPKEIKHNNYSIKWEKASRSKLQSKVKGLLKKIWGGCRVFEEMPIPGTRMTLDFYNANYRIALEVDGKQHYKFSNHFHSGDIEKFKDQLRRDTAKQEFCDLNQIRLVRFLECDKLTLENLKAIIQRHDNQNG